MSRHQPLNYPDLMRAEAEMIEQDKERKQRALARKFEGVVIDSAKYRPAAGASVAG